MVSNSTRLPNMHTLQRNLNIHVFVPVVDLSVPFAVTVANLLLCCPNFENLIQTCFGRLEDNAWLQAFVIYHQIVEQRCLIEKATSVFCKELALGWADLQAPWICRDPALSLRHLE